MFRSASTLCLIKGNGDEDVDDDDDDEDDHGDDGDDDEHCGLCLPALSRSCQSFISNILSTAAREQSHLLQRGYQLVEQYSCCVHVAL